MIKKSLQQKIIIIFFVMVAVILIATSSFAYIKIKQVYKNSLQRELSDAGVSFSSSIIDNDEQNYLNFIKYFGINNVDRKGFLFDIQFNSINEENTDGLQIQEISQYIKNDVIEKGNYEYIQEIKDNDGNVRYNAYIIQDKTFINSQLQEYKMIIYTLITILLAITLIIAAVISRNIISPINKLSKSLQEIINGNIEQLEEIDIPKTKNEIYDLIDKFKILTNKLGDNVRKISNQKSQIETILLHMSDGVMAFDVYGNMIYKNPAAIKMLVLSNEDVKFDDIFKKLDININLEKIIYLKDWTSSEKKLNIKDTYVNMYFETFKNEEDIVEGIIVLTQDITKQVKLDDMRKEFVANVSHELKTPITSIKSYSEALLENEVDKDTHDRFLRVISVEAERMSSLVSDLLQLSRFDMQKDQERKTEFDLGELVKKAYDKISIEADKRGHEVECYVTANVPKIYADKTGVEQVVLNVISNAIKYTPDYGQIKIYVGFVYNHAYIKVIDNGIGIPKKDIKRVFERFFRVDKARSREQGGTGLGLAIAKEIIERNNGSIDITSETNKGTEVVIRLPVKQEKQ